MAYTPTTWATGDTITAAKLNNIEDGIVEAAQSGGGGWDAEVCCYHADNSASDFVFTIVSGTFADLLDLIQTEKRAPAILFRWYHESGPSIASTTAVAVYWIDPTESIVFTARVPYSLSNANQSFGFNFTWNLNDTITE